MAGDISKRILIVDDDPSFIKCLGNLLRKDGYEVVSSENGPAGIDAFQAAMAGGKPFDAVITDFGMRIMDGREVAANIKNVSPATPVILLTGWGQWLKDLHGSPLAVDEILNKPPMLAELRETLARCFKSSPS